MKRFYCTVCKRIKRVRKYPTNIENQYADDPTQRIGSCSRHNPDYIAYKPVRKAGAR